MKSSTSSGLSKDDDQEEEQVLEESLTSSEEDEPSLYKSWRTLHGDGASGSGGGGNDHAGVMEKELMFDIKLTPSDIGRLSWLEIPTYDAEKYFSLNAAPDKKELQLTFEDNVGKLWRLRYSYWENSQMYVMTKGWSRFVKEKRLRDGDIVSFYRGASESTRERLFIDWKRPDPIFMPATWFGSDSSGMPILRGPTVTEIDFNTVPEKMLRAPINLEKAGQGGGESSHDPDVMFSLQTPGRQPLQQEVWGPMLHRRTARIPTFTNVFEDFQRSPESVEVRRPQSWRKLKRCFTVVMFVFTIQARVRNPHVWRQTWNHGSVAGEPGKAAERWPAKSFATREMFKPEMWTENRGSDVSELIKVVKRQKLANNQVHHIISREKLKKCLNVVKFVTRIQVGIRGRRRMHYSTHGSAGTDENGIAEAAGFRFFGEPEACSKDVESDSAGVPKVVRRQKLDKNVRSSTFTEDYSFYPKHKHLRSRAKVEKPHSSFYENVNKWIDIRKQCGSSLHQTFAQQIDSELVGRNDIKQIIMEKILLDRNGGSNYTVICINAETGHGKTSLLRVLYDDQQLVDAFDKRIWLQMSTKLDISMLFQRIVEFTMNEHCSITNLRYLQEMVEEVLTDKKIVLFLDDADIEDKKIWNTLLEVLNAGARGSVIVMARRSSITIASFTGVATHSYFLSPLSDKNNMMLLQKYAALGTDIGSNPDLMVVAKRLISRFGSNPLNLKAIGGLLCHTDSSLLQNDTFEGNVMPLQLCHDALPIHLKKCLAFCSLFPEGYIFDRHHIVLLWISRGFVTAVEGRELEDVAVEYFNELLCRSFFWYSPSHNFEDNKFVMHELIYNVVVSVSRDKYFTPKDLLRSVPENILHLSLVSSQFHSVRLMSITEELEDLQTFLVVQPDWQQYKVSSFSTLKLVGLHEFFLKFASLDTVDLSHADIEELPGSIIGMRNLRYLSLNNTSIRALPSEFGSLSNLQTLKAKDCRFLTELPGDTKKLLKLRHLDVTKELGYVHLPYGVGWLTELRTLPVFHASGDSSHCSITELGNLHSLRGCLRLSGLERVQTGSRAQEVNLKDKQHLQDVTLEWHDGGTDIGEDDDDDAEHVAEQVLEGLEPHVNLQELTIRGYEGTGFPAWMQGPSSLPNVVSLTLDGCFNCTQFPAIAQLPSLKLLGVRKMYDVKRLCSDVNGDVKFPSLEVLNLWEMYGLEELFKASKGDCPRLHKICISRCPDLKRLPCIPSVTELVLHFCHQLPHIPELGSLASLKIEDCHSIKSFNLTPAVLPKLKKLEIRSCNELSRVHGLEALSTVRRLKITACPKLVLPITSGPAF